MRCRCMSGVSQQADPRFRLIERAGWRMVEQRPYVWILHIGYYGLNLVSPMSVVPKHVFP